MVVVNYNDERKALTAAQLKEKLEFMDRIAITVLPVLYLKGIATSDSDDYIADLTYDLAETLWARRARVRVDGVEEK